MGPNYCNPAANEIEKLWVRDSRDDEVFLDTCLKACVSNTGEGFDEKAGPWG